MTGITGPAFTRAEARTLAVPAGMVAVALLAVAAWGLAAATRAVGDPAATLRVLGDGLTRGWLLPHVGATFTPVLAGFALALAVGVAGGVWLGRVPYWRSVFEPIALALYAVPKITLYPVFILFFGLTQESRVAMAFIHAVFPILLGVTVGVLEIDPVLLKVRRVLRLSRARALRSIYLPAVAPAVVAGARMGFSLAIIGVVLAELVASREGGLGRVVMDAYAQFDVDRMFAVILLLFVLAMAANVVFWLFERRLRAHRA